MNIRPARPADAKEITRVLANSAEAAYAEILADDHLQRRFFDIDVDSLETRLERTGADSGVIYLVAEAKNGIVGFVQLVFGTEAPEHVDSDVAYLKSLYVRPADWRDGVGEALLTEGLSRIPNSLERVELAVFTQNNIGQKFYEKHGYEQVGSGEFEIQDTSYGTDVYAKTR